MIIPSLLLVAAADFQPDELLPSSKWQVEYAKSSCIVSRAFGEGNKKTIFGLKPEPYSDGVTLLIVQGSPQGRPDWGDAEVKLSGGFVPEYADYSTVAGKGMRITSFALPRKIFDGLAKGESISLKAKNWVNVALKPNGFDKAMKALDDCESDLLTSWGFDKIAQAAEPSGPKASFGG